MRRIVSGMDREFLRLGTCPVVKEMSELARLRCRTFMSCKLSELHCACSSTVVLSTGCNVLCGAGDIVGKRLLVVSGGQSCKEARSMGLPIQDKLHANRLRAVHSSVAASMSLRAVLANMSSSLTGRPCGCPRTKVCAIGQYQGDCVLCSFFLH